ncbi:hypothetical protein Dsin_009890 [Dipteronia sinensis]|uniref:Uncharacterized protein n=1 Tax=Dipteronia sinensis TaxID=43782 RepID=A0AAE0EDW5_9ROSI|nr:hypothetical protein Dsin_009890 [Dipteronia sinensis]
MFRFRQAIDDCDLVDLGFSEPKLTWNNRRDGKSNIHERLDRHWGFRFEPFWLNEDDIGRVVTDVWHEQGPFLSSADFSSKLRQCAYSLAGWSKLRLKNLST